MSLTCQAICFELETFAGTLLRADMHAVKADCKVSAEVRAPQTTSVFCCRQVADFDRWLLDKLAIYPKKVRGPSTWCPPLEVNGTPGSGSGFQGRAGCHETCQEGLHPRTLVRLTLRLRSFSAWSASRGGGTGAREGLRRAEATTAHTSMGLRIVPSLTLPLILPLILPLTLPLILPLTLPPILPLTHPP